LFGHISPRYQEFQYLQLFYYKSFAMFGATIVLNIIIMLNLRLRRQKKCLKARLSTFNDVGWTARSMQRDCEEQFTRRLELCFTIFAILLQSFAVFTCRISRKHRFKHYRGGVKSVQDVVATYDTGANGQNDFKYIDYFGITRNELASV
jgi:hypothetical protein